MNSLRANILKVFNILLRPLRLLLVKKKELDVLTRERNVLITLMHIFSGPCDRSSRVPVECVVFSMDRALQLHALLASYEENVRHSAPMHVLYRTTTEAHRKAYEEVFALFQNRLVLTLYRQTPDRPFKDQVLGILATLSSDKVFFLTDDDLFIRSVDLLDFTSFETRTTVASLRMGDHLKRCYPVQKSQRLPEFIPCDCSAADKLCWIWASGEHDWNYPLSVNGHLFSAKEMLVLAENTEFHSPNTFEANIQMFSKFYTHRLGVCYKSSKILNVPINKVQSDNDNVHGSVHQDFLLDQWNRGLQMDYRALYGLVNESAHQEVPVTFIERR